MQAPEVAGGDLERELDQGAPDPLSVSGDARGGLDRVAVGADGGEVLGVETGAGVPRYRPAAIPKRLSGVLFGMVLWTSHADQLDDGALLAAMAVGDRRAGSVFVRRHQRAVYGLAATMCHDTRLAEDISQQTFERVWKHAGSYDARRATVRVWLLTITRRLCIDVFRASRAVPVDPSELLALLPQASGAVDERALDRVEVQRLRTALLALPETQLRVLLAASLGGYTAAEIAEMEQIPIGTAKTRLRTALMRLRAEFSTKGAGDD